MSGPEPVPPRAADAGFGLAGGTAIVTGAARGIGLAIARRLHDLGVTVSGWDLCPDFPDQAPFAECRQADVADEQSVATAFAATLDVLGHVDILVNNAGIIDDALLVRMSDDSWERVIDTNLNGTFYCTRAALRTMLRRRWGRIINIGSVVGLRGNPGQTNYTASKAGIIGFTKALAKEVATRNITVNTVTPGYLETETTAVLTDEQKAYWLSVIPQGHFGEVDDIAHLVAFLATDKAKYITGQAISVDGGMAV